MGYLFLAKLTKSKLIGVIFSLLFVTSYIGLMATTWASSHVVYVDLILIILASYQYLLYLSAKTKRNFILFLIILALAVISDPGRAFPFAGVLVFLFLIDTYRRSEKNIFRQIFRNKELRKIAIYFSVTLVVLIGWKVLVGKDYTGAIGRPHKSIPFETLKYFFGSIANLIFDPFLRPSEFALESIKQMEGAYFLSAIILPVIWLVGLYRFIKTRSHWWSVFSVLFFWVFVFNIPSWLNYPRSYIAATHRYMTLPGFGFIGLLALAIYLIQKKNRPFAVLLFIAMLFINILTVNFYLKQEEAFRDEKTISRVWATINKSIPQQEEQSLVYVTGDEPLATYGIDYTAFGAIALMRGTKNPSETIRISNDLEKLANLLCHQGINSEKLLKEKQGFLRFHAFYIKNNGETRDITQAELLPLEMVFQKKDACSNLRKKYGDIYVGETTK